MEESDRIQGIYRMLDANRNRVAEGLRVIEDFTRFCREDRGLTERIRQIRHEVRKNLQSLERDMMAARCAARDPGRKVSAGSDLDRKTGHDQLVAANFRRAEEGIRVIEESLHQLAMEELAKEYEGLRFRLYDLEKAVFLQAAKKQKMAFWEYSFYGITAEEYSLGRSNPEIVAEMLAAGIRIIQYREKEKNLREKYAEAKILRRMTRESGALFLVNDHVDLALLVEADGVHIGQDDLPLPEVRKLLGPGKIIGVSTHSPEQARRAVAEGADYIGVGPLFATATKKDVCPPVGLGYLDFAVKEILIPLVAIGGIKEYNLEEVCRHGARCVAMVTEITGSENIREKIGRLRALTKKYWR
ncbi:MAG: thiamine phosphate synthase [Clostridia bacterium]|nr:thiamine phosphate synthase [Clostridia bacterium]